MSSDQTDRIPIPDRIEDITAEWLTAALQDSGAIDCCVADLTVSPFGEGVGMMSTMARCRPRYDAPRGGEPASLVVKLEPTDPASREKIDLWRGFEREIRFYKEVVKATPFRVPRFFHGAFDSQKAVIVLEDLEDLSVRDQVHGLHDHETVAAVRQIARLHGRYWNSPTLGAFDWMPINEGRLTDIDEHKWAQFEEVYGVRIGSDAVALGRRLCDSLDWLRAEMDQSPRTICHGDFRADNMLFGEPGSHDEVVIIDWQVCTRCFGALDIARLLGGSEPAAERMDHFNEVFETWCAGLREAGVSSYGVEDAWRDLQLGALVNLCTPVRILSIWGPDATGRRGQLLDAIATRVFALATEIEAAQRLP